MLRKRLKLAQAQLEASERLQEDEPPHECGEERSNEETAVSAGRGQGHQHRKEKEVAADQGQDRRRERRSDNEMPEGATAAASEEKMRGDAAAASADQERDRRRKRRSDSEMSEDASAASTVQGRYSRRGRNSRRRRYSRRGRLRGCRIEAQVRA